MHYLASWIRAEKMKRLSAELVFTTALYLPDLIYTKSRKMSKVRYIIVSYVFPDPYSFPPGLTCGEINMSLWLTFD